MPNSWVPNPRALQSRRAPPISSPQKNVFTAPGIISVGQRLPLTLNFEWFRLQLSTDLTWCPLWVPHLWSKSCVCEPRPICAAALKPSSLKSFTGFTGSVCSKAHWCRSWKIGLDLSTRWESEVEESCHHPRSIWSIWSHERIVDSLEPKPIARRPLGTPRRLSWSTLGRNWNATNHHKSHLFFVYCILNYVSMLVDAFKCCLHLSTVKSTKIHILGIAPQPALPKPSGGRCRQSMWPSHQLPRGKLNCQVAAY